MKVLTREEILAAADSAIEPVDVPEWGGRVFVRTITGDERDRFDQYRHLVSKKKVELGARAFLVAMACCDEKGNVLFRPEDVQALGQRSAAALDRVSDAAFKLNGLGLAGEEDAEKNSESGTKSDSGCSSPAQLPTPASDVPSN